MVLAASVLVARDGAPILEMSAGMANREARIPNTHETRYNLGSIMKHYTAVLVLQQVERGTIELADTLEAFDTISAKLDLLRDAALLFEPATTLVTRTTATWCSARFWRR